VFPVGVFFFGASTGFRASSSLDAKIGLSWRSNRVSGEAPPALLPAQLTR
jgi:hypothetical protein